jgi:hypothetical protein
MGTWQDWLVTAIAAVAAVLVVWRTLGSWKDSKPSAVGTPHCDGCAIAEAAKETTKK